MMLNVRTRKLFLQMFVWTFKFVYLIIFWNLINTSIEKRDQKRPHLITIGTWNIISYIFLALLILKWLYSNANLEFSVIYILNKKSITFRFDLNNQVYLSRSCSGIYHWYNYMFLLLIQPLLLPGFYLLPFEKLILAYIFFKPSDSTFRNFFHLSTDNDILKWIIDFID